MKSIKCIFLFIICVVIRTVYADDISYVLEQKNIEKSKKCNIMQICRGINGIKTNKKVVALTFDDGPHKKYTNEILEVLKQHNIKATFFVIGKNAENYPDVVKNIYLNGNDIGNHTYSHFYLTKLSNKDIEKEITSCNKIIQNIIYEDPLFFRPPYGACSARTSGIIEQLNITPIGWSDMTDDYNVNNTTHEKIADELIKYVRPGAIIGMHDGGGNREKTVLALPIIIQTLKAKGYKFLTVSELVGIDTYRK